MPTVDENLRQWDETFNWDLQKYWSARWGGDEMQWYGTILPRIHAFVPTQTILELGPGWGRISKYLAPLCEKLVLVDVAPKCIEACKLQFDEDAHVECHVNDGTSLDMVAANSVDFVFSFDSLVHAGEDALAAYVRQLADKLTPDGVAFLHHSNLGAYPRHYRFHARMRPVLQKRPRLQRAMRCCVDDAARGWRDPGVSAAKMVQWCEAQDLCCISQELLTHFTRYLLKDCISLVVRRGSKWDRDAVEWRNTAFMREALHLCDLSHLYCPERD